MTGSLTEKKGYFYMVLSYKDELGKWKTKWKSTGLKVENNKKKAKEMLTKFLAEQEKKENQSLNIEEDMLFGDFMLQWLNDAVLSKDIAENTYNSYLNSACKDIIPYFNNKKITVQNIRPKDIQDFIKYLLTDKTRQLSPNTVIKKKVNIHRALTYACSIGIRNDNPASLTISPKRQKYTGAKAYSISQVNSMIDVLNNTKDPQLLNSRTAIILCVCFGLRRSEVTALKWSAITDHYLEIKATCVEKKGKKGQNKNGNGVLYKDVTKSQAGYRRLPINDELKAFLSRTRKKQLELKMLYGEKYLDSDFVCTWEVPVHQYQAGNPVKPDYLTRNFKKILNYCDLPEIRTHDLRHTTAAILLSLGYELQDVKDWLGHSTITVTSDYYGHLFDDRLVEISNTFAEQLTIKLAI